MIRTVLKAVRVTVRRINFRLLHFYAGITGVQNRMPSLSDPASILRMFGAQIGEGTIVYPGLVIHAAGKDFSNLRIGKNCRVLRDVFLDLTDVITLEDNTSIGIRNTFITHVNAAKSPLAGSAISEGSAPIILKEGAVTYAGVTVLMGVVLERCSAVGAGSVVSRSVPEKTLVMGNPARRVKTFELTEGER